MEREITGNVWENQNSLCLPEPVSEPEPEPEQPVSTAAPSSAIGLGLWQLFQMLPVLLS